MNVRMTLSEVVSSLTEAWEQITLVMAAQPQELADCSNWMDVIDREVSVMLEEAGWTREAVLDALRGRVSEEWLQQTGLTDMLCCCV